MQLNTQQNAHAMVQFDGIVRAFDTQNQLNERLRVDWTSQGWPFLRAAYLEAAECFAHFNWAWWKGGTYDAEQSPEQIAQFHLELVDILHFLLCAQLQQVSELEGNALFAETPGALVMSTSMGLINEFQSETRLCKTRGRRFYEPESKVERLMQACLHASQTQEVDMAVIFRAFVQACVAANLTLDMLLIQYFAKNTLNEFRWNNGYQTGEYRKMWPSYSGFLDVPVEDNVVLSRGLEVYLTTAGDDALLGATNGTMRAYLSDHLQRHYSR